jgi:predicted nuclease of predicted toxin-antitoxin system
MKLLVDMNLPPRWVEFLAANGIEAAHWSGVGDPRASDGVIMKWATDHGQTVFTHDLDFTTTPWREPRGQASCRFVHRAFSPSRSEPTWSVS